MNRPCSRDVLWILLVISVGVSPGVWAATDIYDDPPPPPPSEPPPEEATPPSTIEMRAFGYAAPLRTRTRISSTWPRKAM